MFTVIFTYSKNLSHLHLNSVKSQIKLCCVFCIYKTINIQHGLNILAKFCFGEKIKIALTLNWTTNQWTRPFESEQHIRGLCVGPEEESKLFRRMWNSKYTGCLRNYATFLVTINQEWELFQCFLTVYDNLDPNGSITFLRVT